MAPHHGSRKSNSPELARWCRPRWVVFSDDGRLNTPEIDRTYQALGGQTLPHLELRGGPRRDRRRGHSGVAAAEAAAVATAVSQPRPRGL